MWPWLANLAALLGGAAAAVSLTEKLGEARKRRREHAELKRGMVLPKEAARALEHQIGGRVGVGRDPNGYMLVVFRSVTPPPSNFAGYRVKHPARA